MRPNPMRWRSERLIPVSRAIALTRRWSSSVPLKVNGGWVASQEPGLGARTVLPLRVAVFTLMFTFEFTLCLRRGFSPTGCRFDP